MTRFRFPCGRYSIFGKSAHPDTREATVSSATVIILDAAVAVAAETSFIIPLMRRLPSDVSADPGRAVFLRPIVLNNFSDKFSKIGNLDYTVESKLNDVKSDLTSRMNDIKNETN